MTADFMSKVYDFDDWGITDEFFHFLNSLGQELTFDRFASASNAKLKLFNSKYWDRGFSGIDAFCQDWSGHYNLLVPPVHLVLRCFYYWTVIKANGILVAPAWELAVFWPVFFRNLVRVRLQFVLPLSYLTQEISLFLARIPKTCLLEI